MPSPISISVRCAPHLVQFMTSIYGPQPINFPRKDNFSLLLNFLLEKEPMNYCNFESDLKELKILLPYFDDKNVLYNYILTPLKEAIFINKIDERFNLAFIDEMNKSTLLGINKIDSVHLFMDKYNLSEDCIDMLLKKYQRYIKVKRYQKSKKNNKNHVS